MVDSQGITESFQDFSRYKQEIIVAIEQFKQIGASQRFTLEEIRNKLDQEVFELVVVGQFKRGKTYLINALLGEELLPTGVVPLTSIVTVITYGEKVSATVFFADGITREIAVEEIGEYVTEIGNPRNEKNVQEVQVSFPSEYLRGGVKLVDTPGVGSVYKHNTDIAYKYLPKSDAAIFVLSIDQPASEAELDFLKDVRNFAHKIFFVLNKIDVAPREELDRAVSFTRSVLEETMGKDVRLFPVSAKWALEGKNKGLSQLLEDSGLQTFSSALEAFLMEEKGRVLVCSAAHRMLWYLSEASLSLELERKALLSPIEELRAKLELFDKKRSELSIRMTHLASIIDNSVNKTILSQLDADLRSFRQSIEGEIKAEVLKIFEDYQNRSLEELNEALRRCITDGLYDGYMAWCEKEREILDKHLQEIFDPLRRDVEVETAELMKFSSELFDLPAFSGSFSMKFMDKAGSVFRIKQDPVALELLDTMLTEKVPRWMSRFSRLKEFLIRKARDRILKRWLNQLSIMSDMYSGRARFALVKTTEKATDQFRRGILEGVNRTLKSLSDAISKGMEVKERSEAESRERVYAIEKELVLVNSLRERIGQLYTRVSFSS
ncbi:MAG: dynamin family protein [Thermodesulforhabdaceae bacterium]